VAVSERKRPANLIYDVDDVPPRSVQIGAAFQHVLVMSVGWIYVMLAVSAIGGTSAEAQSLIRMSMIASGIATIVQAWRGVGNGYLCPLTCSLTYLAPMVMAGQQGGYSLMFGMVLLAGVASMLLSRLVYRLRFLFPPEVTGLMVTMSGLQLVAFGCPRFLGYTSAGSKMNSHALLVGVITLVSMIIPTIYTRWKLHLFPMIIGVLSGYIAAFALDDFHWSSLTRQMPASFLSIPERIGYHLSFSLILLPPFLIAALAATLKTVGDTTLCQKVNDASWKRIDMASVRGGVFANGLGSVLSGLLGGMAQNTASSSIGLSVGSGTASRAVALPLGLLVIGLAFFPRLAVLISAMPGPAVGAILIYSACFIVLGGLQVLSSRMLDARRIFAVGIAFIFGLSVEIAPELYRPVPAVLHPIFNSSTSLATVLVVILSVLFRIGLAKQKTFELSAGHDNLDEIDRFLSEQGSAWGMRKEVVTRAIDATYEVMNTLRSLPLRSQLVTVYTEWDELRLEVEVEYDGPPIEIGESLPSLEELNTASGVAQLAAFMIRQHADRVRTRRKDGLCRVQLHFEH